MAETVAASSKTVELSNGVLCPAVGFGCAFGNWTDKSQFFGFQPDLGWQAIPMALDAGYTHLDCAYVYGTHKIVGLSLGDRLRQGAKRGDFFVTTKVFHPPAGIALNAIGKTLDMTNPAVDLKARVLQDFERSLDELNLGYVDLLLMHWPGTGTNEALNRRLRKECWEVFEEIYKSGKARAIGVSNFMVKHFETFLQDVKIAPMMNQIEISPYMTQQKTVEFCKSRGITLTAWAPFGSGATGVLQDATLQALAKKYGKGVGQVILRWQVQSGIVTLPKSSNGVRVAANLDIFDFNLTAAELEQIWALDRQKSSVVSPEGIA